MAHDDAVYRADQLRRDGAITWDDYKNMLRGKFVRSADDYAKEMAIGVRDRAGRLRELQDLGGRM